MFCAVCNAIHMATLMTFGRPFVLGEIVRSAYNSTIPTVAETNTGHFGSRDGGDLRAFSSKCPKEMFYNQRGDLIAKQFGLEGPTLIVGHGPGD